MKKILLILFFAVIGVAVVSLVNTLRFNSKQMKVEPMADIKLDEDKLTSHLAGAIKCKTISYENETLDKVKFSENQFLTLHKYLEKAFPTVHSKLMKKVINKYSLFYIWKGQEENLNPILLLAHLDVVPVESGTERKWKYSAFSGQIANGYIWGRGAMDDKSSVIGILEAVEFLLKEGFSPKRTILLAFGHDEEIAGKKGSSKIAAFLKSKNIKSEYVLDEGLAVTKGFIPGLARPAAIIGIAEKGYLSLVLSIKSEGGHSSTPPQQTAIGILSTAVSKLESKQFPLQIKGVIRSMFDYIGPELPLPMKLIFANLWLTEPLVKFQLAVSSPETNALLHTTTAPTIFKSGIKDNILPTEAKAVINFRILPGDTIDSVIMHVQRTINDSRINIKILEGSCSPSKMSQIESASFKNIQRTIQQVFPDAIVSPGLVLAATDSRYYDAVAENVYKFIPLEVDGNTLKRVHGINERISIKNYEKVVQFYIQLIRNSGF